MTESHQSDFISAPPAQQKTAEEEKRLRTLTHILYALYAISCLTAGISSLAAVMINYIKREDVAGTLYASHFRWQIRTFWWTIAWMVLGFTLMLLLVGVVVLWIAAIWTLYRVIKGWLYLYDNKPMPV